VHPVPGRDAVQPTEPLDISEEVPGPGQPVAPGPGNNGFVNEGRRLIQTGSDSVRKAGLSVSAPFAVLGSANGRGLHVQVAFQYELEVIVE
jgi:hypothetical protein